jgi:hypothetical protein
VVSKEYVRKFPSFLRSVGILLAKRFPRAIFWLFCSLAEHLSAKPEADAAPAEGRVARNRETISIRR